MTTATTLAIGATVRILPVLDSSSDYHGEIGEIAKIKDYPHLGERSSYGVTFGDSWAVLYFSESELEQVWVLDAALNNEDEAVAVATTDKGVSIEVTYYTSLEGGHPFWIWMEQGLEVVNEEDVHLAFDIAEVAEALFNDYGLDVDATIWARQSKVEQEAK